MKRVELFEKGDKQALVGIDENDNVSVTYFEFKRLVELDGWRFSQNVITKDQAAAGGRETLEKLND